MLDSVALIACANRRRQTRVAQRELGVESSTKAFAVRSGEGASRSQTSTLPASADVFDDLDELVEAVALLAGEVDEFLRSLDDGAAFRCARDRDAAPAAELQ